MTGKIPRYEDVTESPGGGLTAEAGTMIYTRYALAAELSTGLRVLEIGCGAGVGLGMIAARARWVVGGEFSPVLSQAARRQYASRVPVVRLTAEQLPFAAGTIDLVLMFETSYYVPRMDRAFAEIRRVLAPRGTVVFVNANPERSDPVASPHSYQYHSADQFRAALAVLGFEVTVQGAFPFGRPQGLAGWAANAMDFGGRRLLAGLGLVPRTLAGRARLKRLVFGPLRTIPREIEAGFGVSTPLIALEPGPVRGYKVIFVTGRLPLGA